MLSASTTSTITTRISSDKPSLSPSPIRSLAPYATTSRSRLQALYSDISRQKHSNPTAYHANVHWWQPVLQEYVASGMQDTLLHSSGRGGSRLVLSAGRRLMEDLRVEGVGKPLGIGAVIVSTSFPL
jgi:charged multivesicular body protein 7